jgi:hypothetical protein
VARQVLFDLAVAGALRYAESLGLLEPFDQARCLERLELWYLKTRFAYRIPWLELVAVLKTYPGKDYLWQGGKMGSWQAKGHADS